MAGKAKDKEVIDIPVIQEGAIDVFVLGETPLYFNTMSSKAKRDLLFPRKKNKAEQNQTMKHDPLQEFHDTMRKDKSRSGPTRVLIASTAFKKALQTAALDIPGATKAEIGRLVRVIGHSLPVFGIPRLRMDSVRQAGINRAPDIRTRACMAEWCAPIRIVFPRRNLSAQSLVNLLSASGRYCGVGDFRQEKGAGDFGLFTVVQASHPDVVRLLKTAGRKEQDEALANVQDYDEETEELRCWYNQEVLKRGKKESA